MAIEGPLRELGIHDVFQLLDLSRKTGTLHVTSELRDNSGRVLFRQGRVVGANIKSNPLRIGDLLLRKGRATEAEIERALAQQREVGGMRRLGDFLIDSGVVTAKELEREVRLQIEAAVFELLSWSEGHFRFEDGGTPEHEGSIASVSTESLLMEGARRIDEWSRIVDRVPSLGCIPALAPIPDDGAPPMDLLPGEWEVLTLIDGGRDLRQIAETLVRPEFDVAKVVYGLVATGVVELRPPPRVSRPAKRLEVPTVEEGAADRAAESGAPGSAADLAHGAPAAGTDAIPDMDLYARGIEALRAADLSSVVKAWAQFLQSHPYDPRVPEVRSGIEAAMKLRAMTGGVAGP